MDQVLIVYIGMLFTVFTGGLVWLKFRRDIKRFLGVRHYRNDGTHMTNQ